jgi:dolichyl-phosphate-mannose--protein O-mannosyl transferase
VSPAVQRLNRPWVAVLVVTGLAAAIRLVGLSEPKPSAFDEFYYPKAACILLGESNEACLLREPNERLFREQRWDVGSWTHPPLGKWQMALGIKAFGMNTFGWRFPSAVAGTLVVTITAAIAAIAFRSALWTLVTGLLMATEHMNVVLSRLGLLDVHMELWAAAGFLFLVLDKRWIELRTPEPATYPPGAEVFLLEESEATRPAPPSPILRPWRATAGIAFGAAVAVKWSGVLALAAGVLLALGWEVARRLRSGMSLGEALGWTVIRESFGFVLFLLILPVGTYMAIWLPWANHFGFDAVRDPLDTLQRWWSWQLEMLSYHWGGLKEFEPGSSTPTHPYYARPWRWLLLGRSVSMFVRDLGPDVRQVILIGNPIVFWGSLWALPFAAWLWYRRRTWIYGLIVVGFALQFFPWFLVHRPQFIFYALPFTPMLVLALVVMVRELSDARLVVRERGGGVATDPESGRPAISTRHPYRPMAWLIVGGAVGLFAWFWPVLTAMRITDEHWRAIVWFRWWT